MSEHHFIGTDFAVDVAFAGEDTLQADSVARWEMRKAGAVLESDTCTVAGQVVTLFIADTEWVDPQAGPQDSQGDPGPQGLQGPQGDAGPQGPAGKAGADGQSVTITVVADQAAFDAATPGALELVVLFSA